jgi:hypothetical protein
MCEVVDCANLEKWAIKVLDTNPDMVLKRSTMHEQEFYNVCNEHLVDCLEYQNCVKGRYFQVHPL